MKNYRLWIVFKECEDFLIQLVFCCNHNIVCGPLIVFFLSHALVIYLFFCRSHGPLTDKHLELRKTGDNFFDIRVLHRGVNLLSFLSLRQRLCQLLRGLMQILGIIPRLLWFACSILLLLWWKFDALLIVWRVWLEHNVNVELFQIVMHFSSLFAQHKVMGNIQLPKLQSCA